MITADIMLTVTITVDRQGILRMVANSSPEVVEGALTLLIAGALAEAQRINLSYRRPLRNDTALRERLGGEK